MRAVNIPCSTSGVARPMKLVGHKYGKWSLKLPTPPNQFRIFARAHYDLGWKVASKIVNLANFSRF